MGSVAGIAVLGAMAIAMSGAVFGVGVARVFWADDLRHARKIDEIRSRTEGHLRGTINSLEQTIALLRAGKQVAN